MALPKSPYEKSVIDEILDAFDNAMVEKHIKNLTIKNDIISGAEIAEAAKAFKFAPGPAVGKTMSLKDIKTAYLHDHANVFNEPVTLVEGKINVPLKLFGMDVSVSPDVSGMAFVQDGKVVGYMPSVMGGSSEADYRRKRAAARRLAWEAIAPKVRPVDLQFLAVLTKDVNTSTWTIPSPPKHKAFAAKIPMSTYPPHGQEDMVKPVQPFTTVEQLLQLGLFEITHNVVPGGVVTTLWKLTDAGRHAVVHVI